MKVIIFVHSIDTKLSFYSFEEAMEYMDSCVAYKFTFREFSNGCAFFDGRE